MPDKLPKFPDIFVLPLKWERSAATIANPFAMEKMRLSVKQIHAISAKIFRPKFYIFVTI
ncbi:hypothetical protein JCM17845_06910 [Iodidimonas gelatinilytica]|uniref:Uncharacterized protein n=1 Tax=Iodidimonas gelatinilytica TaxID=1236966 RepID=A0A5A7MVX8_9PROT|nr:hypothetical protein JCM17845_06910 [Iodidimonas gelatinilytica]